MHRFKRLITAAFLTIFSIILLFSAAFAYLIVTPWGGKLLVRYFKKEFAAVGMTHVGQYHGTLQDGFVLKDVRIKGLPYLPAALVRIQEIHVHLPLWDLAHSGLDIFNARIFIPDSDPMVFTGRLYAGELKGNLYGKALDIHEAFRFWPDPKISKDLQGFISSSDFIIQGPLSAVQINGSFSVDNVRYKSMLLNNLSLRAHLIVMPPMEQPRMQGDVNVDSGTAVVRKVNLQLAKSKVIFKGDMFDPSIDIQMAAKVEDMDFHLAIRGDVTQPVLTVSSDPPMPPQEALQVLFTGNAFSTFTSPFNGVTSSQLAENFLDYSFQGMNDDQFGVKTKLTNNLKVGVEMDQMPSQPGETNIYYSRKINGEMDLNDNMSLNVSQQVMTQDSYPDASYQDADPQPETEVYLQYKKRF